MSDPRLNESARRQAMASEMDVANAAERTKVSTDIERLRAARRGPESEMQRSRPGSLGPGEAEALIGTQISKRHDDPLGTYGAQREIGITEDRTGTLGSALDRASGERETREAPATTVDPQEVEIIDPRGRLP